MNTLTLIRDTYTDVSTTGKLYLNGEFLCYCLEDVVRKPGDKVYGQTAIPVGTFKVVFNASPRLSAKAGHTVLTPRLLNVPGFDGVLIHAGNTAADSLGCVLLGTTRAKDFVGSSRVAVAKVYPLIQHAVENGGCQITIVNK